MPPRVAPGHVPIRLVGDGRRRPCTDHLHRTVETACARCRRPFCGDCLTEVGGNLATRDVRPEATACARCREELEALAAARAWNARPWHVRWRPTRAGLRRAAATLAVVGLIAAPVGFIVQEIVGTPVTPEEFARIAIALRGGFSGPDGTNFLNAVFGGTFVQATAPSVPGHEPTRLIDTWATARVPGWRTTAPLPVEMVFALPNGTVANRVILRPQPSEPAATWAREFTIAFAVEGPDGPWVPVAEGVLDPSNIASATAKASGSPVDDRLDVPVFDIKVTPVRWVRFTVRSNGGDPDYTSLAELEVLYAQASMFGATREPGPAGR